MFLTRNSRLQGSRQHDPSRPRHLRVEPLEDRRLLSATRAAEAISQFAYDVYEHMQNEQGNLFYSPLSVATALAMTYAGAAGQTAAEMAEVLHVGTEPGIHSSYGDLLALFASQPDPLNGFDIAVANALWPQSGEPFESDFLNIVATEYDGQAQGLDYSNPSLAEDIINEWVEEQTHGKIQDLVSDLSPETVMVLTNTVYFKALWEQPFDPDHTWQDGWFYLSEDEGDHVEVPMMYTQADVARTTIGGFQVMEMPFKGGASSMIFVLPATWATPNVLTTGVLEGINNWLEGPHELSYSDDVYLPKFDITVSTDFNQLLGGLGMPTAFGAGADFSEMIDGGGVFIDKVFHKATIEINEQGTEAAAATEVEIVLCFAAGTPVLTPEGEKPIEEVQAGDYVLARDEHNLEGAVEPRIVERVLNGEGNIVELQVGGQVIRTTAPHPFFVRGKGWTPAGEIKVEDRISTNHGDWIEVEKVSATNKSEPIYNLRVAGYRTYFVGSRAWKFGVWVHNDYGSFEANRPFHFLIRDNETSTITFMGRIDNPTQSENDLNPSVPPPRGDFDGDGDVDGRDFLRWQRGNSPIALSGGDLADWQAGYGTPSLLSEATAIDSSPSTSTAKDVTVVDAAVALVLLDDAEGEDEPTVLDHVVLFDEEFAAVGASDVGPLRGATAVSGTSRTSDRSVEVTSNEDTTWLADELMERVFG